MLRRIAWAMGCLVGAVVFGVPLWIQTHRADLPDPGDADLVGEEQRATGVSDGFEHIRAAAARTVGLDDEDGRLRAMRMRESWDPELLADLRRRNTEALAELEQGLTSDVVRMPDELRGAASTLDLTDLLVAVHQLVKLVTTEAQGFDRRGDREQAIDRALFGLRVGSKLARAQDADLLTMVFAVACQGIGLAEVERLLPTMPMTAVQARALAGRIGAHRISAEAWRAIWLGDYRNMKRSLLESPEQEERTLAVDEQQPLWRRWLPEDYLFQPNRTFSSLAVSSREQQRLSARSCRESHAATPPPLEGYRRLGTLIAPNSDGNIFVAIATPNYSTFHRRRCQNASQVGLVQLAVAIRAYMHAHGALPDDLHALVPDYLDAVPLDRYDGAPLRYAKAKGIVYSIGDDLVDSGGFDPPSQSERSEPTIRVAL